LSGTQSVKKESTLGKEAQNESVREEEQEPTLEKKH